MYKAIVVGTDGSTTAQVAVDHAIELSKLSGGRLHLVAACKVPSAALIGGESGAGVLPDGNWQRDAQEAATEMLRSAVTAAEAAGVDAETHAAIGDPAEVLMDVAREVGADLLVVGNRGMAGVGRLLGSVPNKVSHHSPCHLLIVRTT